MKLIDKIQGSLVGGVIGDAWGRQYEGVESPNLINKPKQFYIPDDTQLTLATCEAIVKAGRPDPEAIAQQLADCFIHSGVRGVGSSTLKALRDLAAGAHWALSGAKGEYTAGNGAAMRSAPLAFLLNPDNPADRTTIRDIARITHHNEEAYIGSLGVVYAIQLVLSVQKNRPLALLSEIADKLPDSRIRDRLMLLSQEQKSSSELGQLYGSSGYVVESVPLAIYIAQANLNNPLKDTIQASISAGGDTDTIASIAGQIAGAYIGFTNLPQDLYNGIAEINGVLLILRQFINFVEQHFSL